MAQGSDFSPIRGTKTIKYLEQNLGAVDIKIPPEEDKYIRYIIISMGGASGNRTIDSGNSCADSPPL